MYYTPRTYVNRRYARFKTAAKQPVRYSKPASRFRRTTRGISRSRGFRRTYRSKGRRHHKRRGCTRVYGPQPVGNCSIAALKYVQSVPYTLVANTPNLYQFNLNSVFAPDYTGTLGGPHQPYAFDQYALFYNRYRVFATSWHIEFSTNTPAGAFQATVIPQDYYFGSIAGLTKDNLAEQPRAVTRWITDAHYVMKGKMYLPHLNGNTSAQYKANENAAALVNANPAENMALAIILTSFAAQGITARVTLKYHVEFFDAKALVPS